MSVVLGSVLALGSAAAFGLNNASLRRGVLKGTVIQALMITVPTGAPFFLIGAFLSGELARLPELLEAYRALLLLSLAGILHFVLGRYCNYRASQAVGASFSGPIQQLGVAVSFTLGVLVLGERPSLWQYLGALLVVLAPLVLMRGGEGEGKRKLDFVPQYREGFVFGLLTAAAYGTSPILIRAGLLEVDLPVLGGMISYVAAAAFLIVLVAVTGQWQHATSTKREAAPWFLLSGVMVGLSQMLRFLALSLAPVTVVGPIQSLSMVFRVVFGSMFNRAYEIHDARVLSGVAVSLLGALVVAVGA